MLVIEGKWTVLTVSINTLLSHVSITTNKLKGCICYIQHTHTELVPKYTKNKTQYKIGLYNTHKSDRNHALPYTD